VLELCEGSGPGCPPVRERGEFVLSVVGSPCEQEGDAFAVLLVQLSAV
jgi:hypothetical protein